MTDTEVTPLTTTAGDILRDYRLDQKVSLIDLANVLRVSVIKLEALENNAWDQLHDAMFVRSLSLAVCRQLQTDAAPVLSLLPAHDHSKLGEKNEKLYKLVDYDTDEEREHNRKVYDRTHELEEQEWNELFEILKGQNYKEYYDTLSEEEKKNPNNHSEWFDGSGLRGWWD